MCVSKWVHPTALCLPLQSPVPAEPRAGTPGLQPNTMPQALPAAKPLGADREQGRSSLGHWDTPAWARDRAGGLGAVCQPCHACWQGRCLSSSSRPAPSAPRAPSWAGNRGTLTDVPGDEGQTWGESLNLHTLPTFVSSQLLTGFNQTK